MPRSDFRHHALFWILYGGQQQPALSGVALWAQSPHTFPHGFWLGTRWCEHPYSIFPSSGPRCYAALYTQTCIPFTLKYRPQVCGNTTGDQTATLLCVFVSHHAHDYFKPTCNLLGFWKCSFNSLKALGISFTGRSTNDTFFNYSFSSCHNAWPIPSPDFRFLPLLYSLFFFPHGSYNFWNFSFQDFNLWNFNDVRTVILRIRMDTVFT